MRARMIDTFGLSGTKERFVAHLQKEAIPAIEEQEGYRGMLVLGDRRSEHVIHQQSLGAHSLHPRADVRREARDPERAEQPAAQRCPC
jgi:hypothetical protein